MKETDAVLLKFGFSFLLDSNLIMIVFGNL